jgi:Ser/Thr protein kinase RdoA (MazF antagonist)
MTELGAVIAQRLEQWGAVDLPLERLLFGSTEPDRIAEAVDAWCRAHLGAAIDHYRFFEASSGSVHGVALTDGREVVVKGHRPAVAATYLRAVAVVQKALADAAYPAPQPLAGPLPLRTGHMTAETMLPRGSGADGHAPHVRAALARGLARFVEITRPYTTMFAAVREPMEVADGELYPTPHSPRFDFAATAPGAEWIDELAAAARARLRTRPVTPTVVHGDWRIENLCVDDERVVAVYDWDSVGLATEAVALATAATTFSVDWQQPPGRRFPAPPEIRAFISDYERARGTPLAPDERETLAAAIVAGLSYGARCEHAIANQAPPVDDSQRGLLQHLGAALLDDGLAALFG